MGSDPTHHGSHFARVCRILQPRISRHCLRLPSVTVRKERSHLETQAPHTRPYSSIASGTDYAGHVFPAQTIHRTRGGVGLFINVPIRLLVLITGIDYQRLTTNRHLPKRRRRSGSGTNYGYQHEFYFAFCVQVSLSLFWWLYHCVLLLMRFASILSFCSLVFATPRTSYVHTLPIIRVRYTVQLGPIRQDDTCLQRGSFKRSLLFTFLPLPTRISDCKPIRPPSFTYNTKKCQRKPVLRMRPSRL